jgi:hypothetical protein
MQLAYASTQNYIMSTFPTYQESMAARPRNLGPNLGTKFLVLTQGPPAPDLKELAHGNLESTVFGRAYGPGASEVLSLLGNNVLGFHSNYSLFIVASHHLSSRPTIIHPLLCLMSFRDASYVDARGSTFNNAGRDQYNFIGVNPERPGSCKYNNLLREVSDGR